MPKPAGPIKIVPPSEATESSNVTGEAPCGCKWYADGPPFRCVTHRHLTLAMDAFEIELEVRQNELYLAMGEVEKMPASEEQTACIIRLGDRMRKLVELRGKSEVGRGLDVKCRICLGLERGTD